MKNFSSSLKNAIFFLVIFTSALNAQLTGLHGDDRETRMGLHSGNEFVITFYNDGTYGAIYPTTSEEVEGEWPKGSGHGYLIDGNIFVGSEVRTNRDSLIHILSENKSYNYPGGGGRGDINPITQEWWTFLPLPGFANPSEDRIAMVDAAAEWKNSWPAYWPDKFNDVDDPGWRNDNIDNRPEKAAWNGYFGKNVFNADQESYFVADDYMNREFMSLFKPDDNDPNRGGLGLRLYVRGFQWAKSLVEDALFVLYDIENIGTYNHDKMLFGYKVGNNMGQDIGGQPDAGDDNAAFIRDSLGVLYNMAYMYDDNLGASGWVVGYFGAAFLESPGNPFDGIDNDNDGHDVRAGVPGAGTGDEITEAMFDRGTLQLNTPIVLIDYNNTSLPRTVTTFGAALTAEGKGPSDTLIIRYGIRENKFWVGKQLVEDETVVNNVRRAGTNLIDDNLNGVIDENRGISVGAGMQYLYVGYRSINYFTGAGQGNLLLDERRDDGIDNDGDWAILTDDVGADGLSPSAIGYPGPDLGEKDGIPSDGEPRFDKTDIDESDMIGLTSVNLYLFGAPNNQYDDETFWTLMLPGTFSTATNGNVELLFGSGYFPMPAGKRERFSMGIVLGNSFGELLSSERNVAQAYGANYNFAKAPNIPTVRAVPGDNKVTLFWDDFAEQSEDPITGLNNATNPRAKSDFEGYRIYRSTDPAFNDGGVITDAKFGSKLWSIPIAQFDLDNGVSGFATVTTLGVQYNLGTDNGLRHYFVDTTAKNGTTYFYAVTAYDRGSVPVDPVTGERALNTADTIKIDPSECTKYARLTASGEIERGKNVVIVRPEAPAGGFTESRINDSGIILGPQNTADGKIAYKVIDPTKVKQNHTYKITFQDSSYYESPGQRSTLTKSTSGFTLIDTTPDSDNLHTVIFNGKTTIVNNDSILIKYSIEGDAFEGLPVVDGLQFDFSNNPVRLEVDSLKELSNDGWSKEGIPYYLFRAYDVPLVQLMPGDYDIVFGEVGIGTSKPYYGTSGYYPSVQTNFRIINKTTNKDVDFAFRDRDTSRGGKGVFAWGAPPAGRGSDEILFLANHPTADTLIASWWLRYSIPAGNPDTVWPHPGDVLSLDMRIPFLSNDTYEFTTQAQKLDNQLAKGDLNKIKVVPNPYIVTNSWEPKNPYSDGRGERVLHFTHLPPRCTIRIFNIRGQLVNTLEHDATAASSTQLPDYNGTYSWNMLTKDNLDISYGVYIYHVQADGIGEKVGKFFVIK